MIYNNILELVGHTPLVRVNGLGLKPSVKVLLKLEFFNPGGSIKDRIAMSMITAAEKDGRLKKGGTVIEATGAGNTGIGLAIVSAVKGYKSIFAIPDKVSNEKRNLLKAYGARLEVSPTNVSHTDKKSYYRVADTLSQGIPKAFQPDQYKNPNNPKAHEETTGPEIWKDTKGKVTHVVVGIGTGGTMTGIARFLKQKNKNIKIVAVDAKGSIYQTLFKTGKQPKVFKSWKMEGIGEDFLPKTIDMKYIDELVQVNDQQAFTVARDLARKEGILLGGTSGAALYAAAKISKTIKNGLVVVICPDSGRNYLSKFYDDEWMLKNNFKI